MGAFHSEDPERHEQLASLRTEYDVICRYRLEWARTAQNYGWIAIPVSLTVPAVLYGSVGGRPENYPVILAGFVSIWILLCFWRIISHQIDRQVRLLYVRAIEIEQMLNIEITRRWLRQQWGLDHLPTVQEAKARASLRYDFSRGQSTLAFYCWGYIGITLAIMLFLFLGQ